MATAKKTTAAKKAVAKKTVAKKATVNKIATPAKPAAPIQTKTVTVGELELRISEIENSVVVIRRNRSSLFTANATGYLGTRRLAPAKTLKVLTDRLISLGLAKDEFEIIGTSLV